VSWTGLAGACTHFVVFMDGTPFYIVNIDDGCWGEPKRNGDSLQVEMVNPLTVQRKGDAWHYWAGPIPERITRVLHPTALDKPFRGAERMLPYSWNQVLTNIKLKRLCRAATHHPRHGARMSRDRMSQHTDWRADKFDMGPLWPFQLCNDAAFEDYPIEEYDFVRQFVRADDQDDEASMEEVLQASLRQPAEDPGTEHDLWDEDSTVYSNMQLQKALVLLYGPTILPSFTGGVLEQATIAAVRRFQKNWNRLFPKDPILVDGIPGVQTCSRLEQALLLHTNNAFSAI